MGLLGLPLSADFSKKRMFNIDHFHLYIDLENNH